MSTSSQVIQDIYAAFGRGDIPAILGKLHEQVEWEYGAAPHDIPWLQPRRGRTGAAKFFESLAAVEFHKFEPTTILSEGNVVVALFDLEVTVKASGKRIVEQGEAHIWHFDDKGQVVRFRHCADTLQHAMALRS